MAKVKKNKKPKENYLKKPSILRLTWKLWLYNLFWLALFTGLFFAHYTIEELCLELDHFMMYGLIDFRPQFILIIFLFFFFIRHVLKTCNLIRFTFRMSNDIQKIMDNPVSKRAFEGVEGVGKTLLTAYVTLFLACKADDNLRLRYYLLCPFSAELKNDADFKVVKNSFEYYENHKDKIPHVMLNFKMKYRNQEQYDFDMDYIDMKKRIAEGFVIGLTEVANILPNSESKLPKDSAKKAAKKDCKDNEEDFNGKVKTTFLSLSRQYAAVKIVYDEQRTGEVFLGLRSVTAINNLLEDRIKVLSPHFLIYILDLLKRRIRRKGVETSKKLSKSYKWLESVVEDIGFYIFKYSDKEAIKDKVKTKDNSLVISCDLPFEFDTRGERFNYALFNHKVDESVQPK